MAQQMPALRIIAQPKASYRPRYRSEARHCRNRSQRLVRADPNPQKYAYPTIQIPPDWTNKGEQPMYVRLTHVTVPNDQVPYRCVHPYPVDTEDATVFKDSLTNSLYFPISISELTNGQKGLQFSLYKLTQHELKTYGALPVLNSDEKDDQRFEDLSDSRKIIDTYQLSRSQFLFSLAVFPNNQPLPLIYDVSSVYSHTMTALTTTPSDDDQGIQCSPLRGDAHGQEEILMVIPKVDKRKPFTVRFEHPNMEQRSTVSMVFVDTKTISFYTPPCPTELTRANPSLTVPIVVTQNNTEIARVYFTYQSLDTCINCNNKRTLADTGFDDIDDVLFDELSSDQTNQQVMNLSHVRRFTTSTGTAVKNQRTDHFSVLEKAIEEGNIDLSIRLIRDNEDYLEQENAQGETPLLLAGKFNQNRLIIAILKKRPDLVKYADKEKNNLLHLLANIEQNQAKQTIENVFMILDNQIINDLLSKSNARKQTPEKIARKRGNKEYIDLFTRQNNA